MVSILERALSASRAADAKVRGVAVTYEQHDGVSYAIALAIPTAPRTEVVTAAGVSVDRRLDDWIIEVADLRRLPERGDSIIYNGEEYQVSHPGGGREYDYHDSYHTSLRVHTVVSPRRVDTVAAYGNASGVAYANSSGVAYAKPANG